MWKSKRNVKITYTILPSASSATQSQAPPRLDDLVQYQGLGATDKVKSIRGEDTVCDNAQLDEWKWQGKDSILVKFVTSHWQVLGWGTAESGAQWVVTYFAKTMWTAAGIDIYCHTADGITPELLSEIKAGLAQVQQPGFAELASKIFDIKHDL